jgi:hypothetical protein
MLTPVPDHDGWPFLALRDLSLEVAGQLWPHLEVVPCEVLDEAINDLAAELGCPQLRLGPFD